MGEASARLALPGRGGPIGLLAIFVVTLFLSVAVAQEAVEEQAGAGSALAGLTIVAYGDQEIDFATGITTLPQGGEIIDQQSGVTLTAGEIRYREGDFIEAQGVEVEGEFGLARSAAARVDFETGTLTASGEVSLQRDDLTLEAQALVYFVNEGVLRFDGPVTGTGVDFEARAVLLDVARGALLLLGPYRFQDALFELRSDNEAAMLALTPSDADEQALKASTEVPPELLERLEPYLP